MLSLTMAIEVRKMREIKSEKKRSYRQCTFWNLYNESFSTVFGLTSLPIVYSTIFLQHNP